MHIVETVLKVAGVILQASLFLVLLVYIHRLEERCKRLEKGEKSIVQWYLRLPCHKKPKRDGPYRSHPCTDCPIDNPGICESCATLRQFLDEAHNG